MEGPGEHLRATRATASSLAAAMFAGSLLLIPASLALQFSTLSYCPGGLNTRPFFNPHTWSFVYGSMLAVGALRIRPRIQNQEGFNRRFRPCAVQALVWLLLWIAMVAERVAGGASDPGLSTGLKLLFFLAVVGGPVLGLILTWVLRHDSGKGGMLLAAQLVPVLWILVWAQSWALTT